MKYLNHNNIDYVCEKWFSDCRSSKGWPLRFDFYLPSQNILIEFDGEQHFHSGCIIGRNKYKTTIKDLKEQKERDEIKSIYCSNRGIKLLRIPYNNSVSHLLSSFICQK